MTCAQAGNLGASQIILVNRASERAVKAVADVKAAVPASCAVVAVDCDLTSLESVRAAAAKLGEACGGKLDVLMCNAGIMASPDAVSVDGYNCEVQVNVLSQMLLVKLAMPLLEAAAEVSGEARVVTQSSGARLGPKDGIKEVIFDKVGADGLPEPFKGDTGGGMFAMSPAWHRYGQTKLASSLCAMILHEKLQAKGSKVKAISVAPGLAASDLQSTTNATGNMKAWETNLIFALAGQSANDGALPMTEACLMPGVESGSFYEPLRAMGMFGPPKCIAAGGTFLPAYAKQESGTIADQQTKAAFWAMVEKACGGPIV